MATRLIDLPFTSGLNETVDETVAQLPTMTELTNYRLTRAGRLEHRLGVSAVGILNQVVNSQGGRIDFSKPQAISGRFVAASGHGQTALAFGQWVCNGSLSRYVPTDSFLGIGTSADSFLSPSVTSIFGFLVVAARRDREGGARVVTFDEATGDVVKRDTAGQLAGAPDNRARVVACGTTLVVVTQDQQTGIIYHQARDVTAIPMPALSAIAVTAVGNIGSGFDAAPISDDTYLIAYYVGGTSRVTMSTVDALTGAVISTVSIAATGGFATCLSVGGFRYLAWMDSALQTVCAAVFTPSLVQVGTTQTVGNVPATGLSGNQFHPVLGESGTDGSQVGVIVGWVDSYSNTSGGTTYATFRTTFRELSNAAVLGTTYGPIYGTYLGSKPFYTSTSFVESLPQPAVWLANYNPNVSEVDRSYFLHTIGANTDNSFTWEMSASPSAAPINLNVIGTLNQVPEVVENTGPFVPNTWETALTEAFRGLGTADQQLRTQVYRFGDAARSMRARSRCVVPVQSGLAVLGGAPRCYDGSWLNEIGVANGPIVFAAVPATTGSMTGGATYRYVFVIEYFDAKGQRVLSYVSSPTSVTLGALDAQVNFRIQDPTAWARSNATGISDARVPVVRGYRTSATGTVFRYAPDTANPNGVESGTSLLSDVVYQDTNSDAAIAANEAIYVQVGNALSNYRAPPCRFGCEHEGRLVVAGGWKPNEFYCSKLFFAGEAIQFTESPAFSGVCPEPITGMASLDGSLVLFGERSIYVVTGDGPLDDGTGAFGTPRRLPGRIGCVDWRSVVTVPEGIYFRSLDGIYMLPRGLASATFVGAPIKDSLRAFPETLASATCTRAVASSISDLDSEQVVAWLVGNAESPTGTPAIFVLSLSTNTWSRMEVPDFGGNPQVVMGVWRDLTNNTDVLAFARRDLRSTETGSFLVENPGTGYSRDISDSYEPLLAGGWKTGKLFPFGFGGRGSVRSVRLVGECLAATTLTPTIWSDADAAGYTSDVLTFTPGRFAVEIPFRRRDLAWIQIQVADPVTGSENRGAGLRFNGLALEVEMEPGLHRTTPGERST